MQGRLLPKYQGRYQAHPVSYWQDEFIIARKFELDCIEFILDYNNAEDNPLIKKGGINEIKMVVKQTGVAVKTICADYFMEHKLFNESENEISKNLKTFENLVTNCAKLGVSIIEIPLVDGRDPKKITTLSLAQVIQPRMEEIFDLIKNELIRSKTMDAISSGIVITGGSSMLNGAVELAESIFDATVRLGLPSDIANVVVFFSSDTSDYINGQTLVADGGFLAGGTPNEFSNTEHPYTITKT